MNINSYLSQFLFLCFIIQFLIFIPKACHMYAVRTYFLMFSISRGDLSKAARPSSLYRQMSLSHSADSCDRR